MTDRSLRDFLARLEAGGELVRVREPVSTVLEMTEIHRRVLAEGGPALLFEHPLLPGGQAAAMPVLVNLFGTVGRVALGLGRSADGLRELGRQLASLSQPRPFADWGEAVDGLPLLRRLLAARPRNVRAAPVQEQVLTGAAIDLTRLPVQTCWPGEPAPLITWPLVITRGPSRRPEDDVNMGVYRMQVTGRDTALVRWLPHRGGAQHHARWQAERGGPMPMAVAIGADPASLLAAVTPVPDTLSEYHFSGLLRGAKLDLVPCRTVPLKVPAQAEIVLEGHVSAEQEPEGPYGDHTGYFNPPGTAPRFTVSAVTMRRRPIYLSTFTGRPPDEPAILAAALNEVFVPLLARQFPEVTDVWLPPEACSYRVAVVAIRKAYPGHARRVMMGFWSLLRQFTYTKIVIVVDDDIAIRDWREVVWALATRMDPGRDAVILENTPMDELDFASPQPGLGGKLGLDATNKWPPETGRAWGAPLAMDPEVTRAVTAKWAALGLPCEGAPLPGRGA
ncbi:MAG TPA: UbiD family decarboxylase [Alphaproteobacteria bacterium]|nr:UbiD family decarboxylase [Alphaproteobacteria bacterium]